MEHIVDIQSIVLAAGKGTRMGMPNIPKVLFTIHGEPMILRLLEELKRFPGLKPPVIVVGFGYNLVQGRLGLGQIYAFQQGQLGTAHAVKSAKKQVEGKDVFVLYGDMPFVKAETLNKLALLHRKKKSVFSMLTTQAPSFQKEFSVFQGYGRIVRKGKEISNIVEFADANAEEKTILEVNPGVYLFDTNWLWNHIDQIQPNNKQNEFYLTDIVEIAIKDGVEIETQSVDPWEVFGINTKQQLKQAEEMTNQT
jgi:bifunctional UDP-N-acetylglucosamine pyrophosphorylase/glucosamine-1-phosphate N-acetyltransferase